MNKRIFNNLKASLKPIALLFISALFSTSHIQAQNADDRAKVEEAIRDYVFAIYESDTTKVYKSVHPDLAKRGFYFTDGKPVVAGMSFKRLIDVAKTWRKPSTKVMEPEITIFEVLDLTATAKVKADWGIDYFHLSKISGEWKIYNVMWQKHPPKQ